MHPRDLTILTSCRRDLRKVWTAGQDKPKNYDHAATFSARSARIRDLHHLAEVQRYLQAQPWCCVVRAAVKPGIDHRTMARRVLNKRARDGAVLEATMTDVPREWVAFDIDNVPAPEGWYRPHRVVDFTRYLVERTFPAAFHGAGFVVVASASAAVKPGAKMRLWFLLDRPLYGHEIKRAMAGAPIDECTLRPVQIIYTAAPGFVGMSDPVAKRVHFAWLDRDLVALEVPPEPARPVRQIQYAALSGSPSRCHDELIPLGALARIVARADEGQRHKKLHGCAWRAGDLIHAGQATAHEIFWVLGKAAKDAGLADPPEELARIIKCGLERAGGGAA
jgi:hypothetical protein